MRDKFLYFGGTATLGTESFDNVAVGTPTVQLTTGFQSPIPAQTDFLSSGGAKVTIPSIAGYTWGTAYGTPADAAVVDITKGCTITTGALITIKTTAQDAVNGLDLSSVQGDNDTVLVTKLKPTSPEESMVYPASNLKGIAVAGASSTVLNFVAKTFDANAIDAITVAHGAAKHKEFLNDLTDVIADDNKVSGMVVVVDDLRDLQLAGNAGGITAVTASFDAA